MSTMTIDAPRVAAPRPIVERTVHAPAVAVPINDGVRRFVAVAAIIAVAIAAVLHAVATDSLLELNMIVWYVVSASVLFTSAIMFSIWVAQPRNIARASRSLDWR